MISLILPTYNEAANIGSLVNHIDGVLQSVPHEIIVVDDDSPDGTWKVAEGLTKKHPALRVLRRVGRRGLSSAVVEGFDMAHGDVLAVMDADGQHDATLLLKLLSSLNTGADIAVGSRYVAGGSVGEWVRDRRIISSAGTKLAKSLSNVRISDPLGGFFALKASLYEKVRPKLRPTGFKILLEILANVPEHTRLAEIPLIFRMRLHGKSKLSATVQAQFLFQTLRLASQRLMTGSCTACGVGFWIACIVIAAVIVPRLWNMRLLYTSSQVRHQVERAIRSVAAHEGWLLSDVSLTRVTPDLITIIHREHMRDPGGHPQRCTITLPAAELRCVR